MTDTTSPHRPIRSFVRREGRITASQERALQELWPHYGVEAGDAPLDFDALFGRRAPTLLEIGFGNGSALLSMAAAESQNNYLGIEVHRPGVGQLLQRLDAAQLTNVRTMLVDAQEALAARIPDDSLAAVHLFFPDPWPKQRHRKRRLVQSDFVALVRRKLMPRGYFYLATDWENYAEHMLTVLSTAPGLINTAGVGCFALRPDFRPLTKFEQRGHRLGHAVWDLSFQRAA